MDVYIEKLRALEDKIRGKQKLENRLHQLQKEEWDLREALEIYLRQVVEEQSDVDALTGRTLKGFLTRLQKNTYQEKLTKEQAEAAAAVARQEAAEQRLLDITAEKNELMGELRQLQKTQQEYDRCLAERRQWLSTQTGAEAEAYARLEAEAETIRNRKKEVDEAVLAGRRVKELAAQIDRELFEAEGWGTWDAWGGGPLADVEKYDHLDKAGNMSRSLQKLISDFQTELADVARVADISLEIDEFTRFADFFWDGLFVNLKVLDRIRATRYRVQELEKELEPILQDLNSMSAEVQRELTVAEDAQKRLVIGEE